ncbi:unnamed protein product, partial [Ectocarpus sp. 13 AM-2016]
MVAPPPCSTVLLSSEGAWCHLSACFGSHVTLSAAAYRSGHLRRHGCFGHIHEEDSLLSTTTCPNTLYTSTPFSNLVLLKIFMKESENVKCHAAAGTAFASSLRTLQPRRAVFPTKQAGRL